ncbi:MAG: thermonuclease family protein [Mariprofundaceae bacterium]
MRSRLAICMAAALCLLCTNAVQAGTLSQVGQSRWVHVGHVYDGDTFRSDSGEKIRLLGINTPEIAHNDKPGQPLGKQAQRRLTKWIAGKTVHLQFDRQRKDNYGRTLAQVYLRDGDWINARLLREGLAHVYTFAPNFRWTPALLANEKLARTRHLGIWNNDRFRVLKAAEINSSHIGQFRVLEGKVSQPRLWRFRMGQLNITVPRKYRQWFDKTPHFAAGQTVRLRGTIRSGNRGALYLALHSPYDIDSPDKE